jgi:cytochrome c-type biogenesis protein CcmF
VPELGRAALIVCLGLAAYGTVAGAYGAYAGRMRLALSARNALLAAFGAALVAAAVLVDAFVQRDFSFAYVAKTSSRDLPFPYSISSFWGGQEGSLLLWLVVLTGFAAASVLLNRRFGPLLLGWVIAVLGLITVFFALLLVFVENPFRTQIAPPDGAGLNPSLQNPYMLIHPVFLYLGFVGMSVPFAFAIGGLLARRMDDWWVVATRRWMLAAWTFLGIGQLLGARWAYLEIGWGGYYGWDPVENAALMPWIAATAFLHSVMVQEKKSMLRVWNVLLVIMAFSLSIFGTLLTRSGLIQSIHAFALSSIGAWFVGFLALTTVGAVGLVLWRLPFLRAKTRLESPVSREAAFLYNNLLLVALTLTVLWGVVYPLISEAVRGEPVTVGPPYYNFFLKAFGLPLLLLMGIGPVIAWRRSSLGLLARSFTWPFAVAVLFGAFLVVLGAASSPVGLLAFTFSAFVLASIVQEFARGTRARHALSGGPWVQAFTSLVGRNRRRYGGYVVHAAVVLFAIGVTGSSLYQTAREGPLRAGETMTIGQYTVRYRGLERRPAATHTQARAIMDVSRDGRSIGTMEPGKNVYPAGERQPFFSTEAAVKANWLSGEDLFLATDRINPDGSIYLQAWVKPLVNLIWLAGVLFLLGSVIALWPDPREERRLALRYAGREALARA